MEPIIHSEMSKEKRLRKQAEQILEMVEGFALMREDAQKTDKEAFIEGYIQFKTRSITK